MKCLKTRIIGALMSLMLCVGFAITGLATPTFAAESTETNKAQCYTFEVTSDGIASVSDENGNEISTYSSISGFEQGTISSNPDGIIVYPTSSGWGGMGVTIKASSSWSGYMNLDIAGSDGNVPLKGKAVYSNGQTVVNNLWHYNPSYYVFSFRGIPSGQSVFVQIWVYG